MAKARGLGKSIFDTFDDNLIESKKGAGEILRISAIEPRRDQPRKTFDRESLEALAESIQKHGVLQPIIVRPDQSIDETYEIMAGERRWRAAKLAGLDEIPAVILDGDDLKIAQVSIIENIQRENLNAVEEALAYKGLMERFGLTQDQVSSYMFNLKYETSKPVHETETLPDREQPVVAKGMQHGSETDWEFGISRYKLLHIGQISNKILLYSTGNYIQCPVINHNGKEYEKKYVYILMYMYN